MIIEICSQERAKALAALAETETAVISITSTDDADVVFPDNPRVGPVLRLKLNDLTEAYDEEGIPYGRPLARAEDFSGLKEFVDGLRCGRLIVHCWEGRSRSAAVAEAVVRYRGGGDTLLFQEEPDPNPRIYRLACAALGG